MDNIDVKALTRNTMLDRLQNKIKKKNIQVQEVQAMDDEDEDEIGEVGTTVAEQNVSILDSDYLFAVIDVNGDLIGGTVKTVEAELAKLKPESYTIKIVTSDENAAKAFFKSTESNVVVADDAAESYASNAAEEYD